MFSQISAPKSLEIPNTYYKIRKFFNYGSGEYSLGLQYKNLKSNISTLFILFFTILSHILKFL